jgi:hypothetical protein
MGLHKAGHHSDCMGEVAKKQQQENVSFSSPSKKNTEAVRHATTMARRRCNHLTVRTSQLLHQLQRHYHPPQTPFSKSIIASTAAQIPQSQK